MKAPTEPLPEATWDVTLEPIRSSETACRQHLLDQVQPLLERRLKDDPNAEEVRIPLGGHLLRARQRSGHWEPGAALRLACAPTMPSLIPAQRAAADTDLICEMLPSPDLDRLDARLVGLSQTLNRVVARLECAWLDRATTWSERTHTPLPAPIAEQLRERPAAFLFSGPPGVGKSALARVAVQRFTKGAGLTGRILHVPLTVRGAGLVGEFSGRLHAAFRTLHDLPSDEVKCLLIDEVDAVCVNRGTVAIGKHQEDVAATAALCRELDCLSGIPRAMVVLTTNLEIDPAVQRRCFMFTFRRPGSAARLQLLSRWLPDASEQDRHRAVKCSIGMAPVDIDTAMELAYMKAIVADQPVQIADVLDALRTGTRTKGV